jgi:hypothetical protein
MTNIRKHKNYDSEIHCLLAMELATEAQNLIYVMAGITALAEVHRPDKARTVRVTMESFRKAVRDEAIRSAGVEQSQLQP